MTKDNSGQIETILELGAEGGSATLHRRRAAGGHWQFRVTTNEAALWDLLGEEAPPPEKLPWVSSWEDALARFDGWPRLYPLVVHPEFKDAILAAVATHEKGGRDMVERWRETLDRESRETTPPTTPRPGASRRSRKTR